MIRMALLKLHSLKAFEFSCRSNWSTVQGTQSTIWGHRDITVISHKPHGEVTVWAHSDLKLKKHIDLSYITVMTSPRSHTVTSQCPHTVLTPWHNNLTPSLTVFFVAYLYYHSLTHNTGFVCDIRWTMSQIQHPWIPWCIIFLCA